MVCSVRENQLYPLHVQPVQLLQPGDKYFGLNFSQCVPQKSADTCQLLCNVLYTDKVVLNKKFCTHSTQHACVGNEKSSCHSSLFTPA
jgi:hypothetical protein